MRPWRNRSLARLARMCRWCAGLPPSRRPRLGVGMMCSLLSNSRGATLPPPPQRRWRGGASRPHGGRSLAQCDAQLGQLVLDLVHGLRPEVADLEQVLLGALHQLADGGDAFALQAVVGPHRQVEVLD